MPDTVVIYGSSDDLVEVEGTVPGCDEYNSEWESFILIGDEGRLRVRVRYTRPGVWAIEVLPVDEGVYGMPVKIEIRGYTAVATIEGVSLVVREREDEDV